MRRLFTTLGVLACLSAATAQAQTGLPTDSRMLSAQTLAQILTWQNKRGEVSVYSQNFPAAVNKDCIYSPVVSWVPPFTTTWVLNCVDVPFCPSVRTLTISSPDGQSQTTCRYSCTTPPDAQGNCDCDLQANQPGNCPP